VSLINFILINIFNFKFVRLRGEYKEERATREECDKPCELNRFLSDGKLERKTGNFSGRT